MGREVDSPFAPFGTDPVLASSLVSVTSPVWWHDNLVNLSTDPDHVVDVVWPGHIARINKKCHEIRRVIAQENSVP